MITEIIPLLFVSSWTSARNARPGFHVVTVMNDEVGFCGQERFPLVDGPGNDPAMFQSAVSAVVEARRRGHKVIVHCHGGRSRSAAVVVAAIAKLNSISICQAYNLVIERHPETRIHPHLSKLLLEHP